MIYEVKATVPIVFNVSAEGPVEAKLKAEAHLAQHFRTAKLLSITLTSPVEGDPNVEAWDPPTKFGGK